MIVFFYFLGLVIDVVIFRLTVFVLIFVLIILMYNISSSGTIIVALEISKKYAARAIH